MNVIKQLSVMGEDKPETGNNTNLSVKIDTPASRFLQKTKTLSGDPSPNKVPISKETAQLVVNKPGRLKVKDQENKRIKLELEKSQSPNNDASSVLSDSGSPRSSPHKSSGFSMAVSQGFLEKIDDQNEDQSKAKQALNLIKKEKRKQNKDQTNHRADFIPFLNNQINHLTNQRATLIEDSHRPGPNSAKNDQKITSNFKIDDPNSILHIANYQQNKEFMDYAKVYSNNEGRKVLKINAPDCQTFFRLHHEISEINRKREEFLNMKKKFFDQKDPMEIVEYDQTIKAAGAIQNPEEVKKKIKTLKEYKKGERIAKKFTSRIDMAPKSKIDEAQVTVFFNSITSPNIPRKSVIVIEDS